MAPLPYRFTARCSGCHKTDTYESSKSVGDDFIKGYFKDRGWLLGRGRAYDSARLAWQNPARLSVINRPEAADPSSRPTTPADRRSRDTADILARHLGKPEALAAEVFRPKPVPSPRPPAPEAPPPTGSAPALSPEVEQALTGMAEELKGLRSTMELIAEQLGKLVALGSQQFEAIARLTPLMAQSAEGISGGFREVVRAIQSVQSAPAPEQEPTRAEKPLTRETEPVKQQDVEISSEPEPLVTSKAKGRERPKARPSQSEDKARTGGSTPVVVKSIPDAKRSDRFYTSIRLPRELWDRAGFGPEDRLLLDWSGKVLTIQRALDGGVKPKSIGESSVVLQSWKRGNLNLDQPKVTASDASLRLMGGRRREA